MIVMGDIDFLLDKFRGRERKIQHWIYDHV